ncbi:efflux RND transporter periplasmic adaptor subunit [Aquabacterium lacunae]|uniref:Efflux RND transporter periplasmic adaptor subunit n=2 Tax=Aquabacterium lacunae TaxID=2528630 RepID=A0A4V2JFU3_9BURK|nr:efflux RND transporter periplasmic adaptor subunit [Aquabacterium lacunae]
MRLRFETLPRSRKAVMWLSLISLGLAGCSKPVERVEPIRAVRTVVLADAGGLIDREFAAEIKARTESRLSFRVGGKITQRQVALGQAVKAGQALAQLDTTDLRLTASAAQASVNVAQVQLAQAQADFKRFSDLKAQGFISQAELDRHLTALKAAEAGLAQARAQSGVQGNQTAYGTLSAPANGVITQVLGEPGQNVAPGEPVLVFAADGPRDAVFAIPEDMGPAVRPLVGKAGAVKMKRWGQDQWVPVTLREMAAAADPVSRTLLVKADVGQADVALGQTATIALSVAPRVRAGVHLPLHALVESQGRSSVWVLDPKTMTVSQQQVITAEVNGNIIQVSAGLKPGQEVVTAGVHVLQPGQKVKRLIDPAAEHAKAEKAARVAAAGLIASATEAADAAKAEQAAQASQAAR